MERSPKAQGVTPFGLDPIAEYSEFMLYVTLVLPNDCVLAMIGDCTSYNLTIVVDGFWDCVMLDNIWKPDDLS